MTSSPWIEQHLEQVVEAVLAAAGHQDLAGLVGQAVIGLEAVGDGGFQLRGAAHRGVAGKALPDGPDGGLPDVVRGVEIRLPHPEVDYIDSLRLELIGLGIQGQGGGRGNLADTTGKLHGDSFRIKFAGRAGTVAQLWLRAAESLICTRVGEGSLRGWPWSFALAVPDPHGNNPLKIIQHCDNCQLREACPVKSVAIITKKFKPDALEAGRALKTWLEGRGR